MEKAWQSGKFCRSAAEESVKVTVEIELTPQEFQEVFIPGEKQVEFTTMTYDAFAEGMARLAMKQVDPFGVFKEKSKEQ